jgi:hypothetical protein
VPAVRRGWATGRHSHTPVEAMLRMQQPRISVTISLKARSCKTEKVLHSILVKRGVAAAHSRNGVLWQSKRQRSLAFCDVLRCSMACSGIVAVCHGLQRCAMVYNGVPWFIVCAMVYK